MKSVHHRFLRWLKRRLSSRLFVVTLEVVALLVVWVVVQFVLAEKESNIYIFPSYVTSEGWENGELSLGQDLSSEAELVDFNRENSAYISVGVKEIEVVTEAPAPSDPGEAPPAETIEIPVAPEVGDTTPVVSSPDGETTEPPPASTEEINASLPVEPTPTEAGGSVIPDPVSGGSENVPVDAPPPPEAETIPPSDSSLVPVMYSPYASAYFLDRLSSIIPSRFFPETAHALSGEESASTTDMEVPAATSTEGDVSFSTSTPTIAETPTTSAAPLSDDPYSFALCTALGNPCHLIGFTGFDLGSALDEKTFSSASLELSLAGREDRFNERNDRVLVRVYHAGRWESLGELPVRGEFSNGKRGGYVSFPLPDITGWGDLSDMKAVVEYVEDLEHPLGPDASAAVYLDGIWVDVKYTVSDTEGVVSPEDVVLTRANVRDRLADVDASLRRARRDTLLTPEGEKVLFVHVDEDPGAEIVIKTDSKVYHALGGATTYFSVTNDGADTEELRLQFHFANESGRVTELSRLEKNVPHRISTEKYDAIGYYCPSTWAVATSTGEGGYFCSDTQEFAMCDALNEDRTNCVEQHTQVGLTEDVDYLDAWSGIDLSDGSFSDTDGLFAKFADLILSKFPDDAIPFSESSATHMTETFLLESGQTAYFRSDIEVPLNGRGDFYIEAAAESGAYGLAHGEWDGSWNHRIPLLVETGEFRSDDFFAVPISLDDLPATFWEHVNIDGSDIRFVAGDTDTELAYWLSSIDSETHSGLAWVRLPPSLPGYGATGTPLFLYVGDKYAPSRSDQFTPFRTTGLTSRGVIFGGNQRDLTLYVVALGDHVQVKAGKRDQVTLKRRESALFSFMTPGDQVFADGPVGLLVSAPGGDAGVVPLGFSGTQFVLPGLGGAHDVALGILGDENAYASLRDSEGVHDLELISGSILGTPVDLGRSVIIDADRPITTRLSSSDAFSGVPIYTATDESLIGFTFGRTAVGYSANGSDMRVLCSSGVRHEVDGRLEGMTSMLDRCISGDPKTADALRVDRINRSVGMLSNVEGDLVGYLPKSELASSYRLTEDARTVFLACLPEDAPVEIGMLDPRGSLVATTTCVGSGIFPGKAVLSSERSFTIGSELRSIGESAPPFLAVMEGDPGLLSENISSLTLLTGAPLARSLSPNHPAIRVGAEEFVVPGEHRKLDVDNGGREKKHVNRFLSQKREFTAHETPQFTFQYVSQSNTIMRRVRDLLGVEPFTVARVVLVQHTGEELPVSYDITRGENEEWTLVLRPDKERIRPGKYTLSVQMEEGGDLYTDEYDFYWGVLAINYQQSVFTPGETVEVSMAALSDNGNTICDARLKLWITDPSGVEREVPVRASGLCDGNNVVDVPDYTGAYTLSWDPVAVGNYKVRLVRLDEADNVASQITDGFEVRESVPYAVVRTGPTRIYPVAHYSMRLHVTANENFEGNIIERLPGDFVVIDRGNADLKWGDDGHTFLTASWNVALSAGQSIDLEYVFDAPDRSPYLYLLGPLSMEPQGKEAWSEARQWQIASDAAGKMLIFWDQTYTPAGWTCVSCVLGDPFYQRFVVGSSTYSGAGGAATHIHTANATVYSTTETGVGQNTTTNTNNAPISHAHTLTPQIENVSNLPAYRQLRVLEATGAGEPSTIPAGAIGVFDIASSSLPTNWNRYTTLDGRYVRGESTVGTIGGANTHTHTATGTLSAGIGSGLRSQNPNSSAATQAHTHTLVATTTNFGSNEPPYVEVVFAQLSATSAPPNYLITMWGDTPPSDWMTISGDGGALNGKYLKASTTYGSSGGATSHTHVDMLGATTSVPSATNAYFADAANAQASGIHTHPIDLTGFSSPEHLPPYVGVIFAKRLSGIILWEQNDYRWYANQNANTPTDPWPPGGASIGENNPIDTSNQPVKPSNVLRLRMSLLVGNSTSTVGSKQFKLQYAASSDCPSALNWSDVDPIGTGGALWRGYDNGGVLNNADIASTTLVNSNVGESYVEQNVSTGTPTEIGVGKRGEWDWVVEDNLAAAGTDYCFRMVLSDGTPLDTYTDYPRLTTNKAPTTALAVTLFDNEKTASTLPDLSFAATDPEVDDLDYEIAISSTTDFAVLIENKDSTVNPELFDNLSNPSNKAPFNSGDRIHFKATTALTNGATYWWHVRAKDPSGSNTWGPWSLSRSFTVDTAVTFSRWYQTTMSQFQTDTLVGVESTSTVTNDVALISGSSTGALWSPRIDFSDGTVGTAWGSFSWSHTVTQGAITYQVEYLDATSTWVLIPNTDLPGNSSGASVSPISLLSVSAAQYPTIRLRANFTNVGGTPKLLDWTLWWGSKVTIPTITTPFDNAKLATTTPSFEFYSSDPEGNDLHYEFQWSTSPSFTSSTTRNSEADAASFRNIQNATDTQPFNTADKIRFTIDVADTLTNGTTYFYRIRAKDPSGANDFSFWSPTRSFTVDTGTIAATWFQTVTGQFDTDTLTSMYNYGVGSSTVATSTTEAMIAYGEGVEQTPMYRIWDGSIWGAQLAGLSVGATIQWVVLKASTVLGEYILGTLGSDRDVNFQVFRNNTWGNSFELTGSSPSVQRRSFDIAYETLSGRALVVACDGDADPSYSIWNGSSWSTAGTVNLSSANNCEWIRLASDPTSNEIILVARDTGPAYEAQVWSGSTWGNATTLGSMSEVAHEGMAVAYEESGDQALVVVSDGNNNDFTWTAWNGAAWSAAAVVGLGDDFENGNLRRDKGTDNLSLCYVDHDNDMGVVRWTGAAWVANVELSTTAVTKDGRPIDCAYENTVARDGYIMTPYSDTTGTRYQFWNGATWSGQSNLNTVPAAVTDQMERTLGDILLSVFFDHTNGDYLFSSWDGATWSSTQTLETNASVTSAPYGEPFMIAPKNPATRGTIISTSLYFADGSAPGWESVSWASTTQSGASLTVQVEYFASTSVWTLIPDADLPGNSTGSSVSPINISTLNTSTYSQIRLVGNVTCSFGNCPILHDWTVRWAPGVAVSGTAKAHDLTSDVTSGTVVIAVNGVLQSGKTGTISGGQWSIPNVTVFSGNTVEVFVSDGAASTRAVGIAKYAGTGDMGGMRLNERWVTIGSASTTFQSGVITLTELSLYDNSVSGDSDLFFDVTAGGDYNHCAVGASCFDSSIYVLPGNTFRTTTATSRTITAYDMRIEGALYAGVNTIKVGGSWRNLGGFTANNSTILFNGTSSPYTIDSTSAATSTFFNVSFGESGNTSTWTLLSALTATGTLTLSYGTLSPGASALNLEGDLTIGSSGTFAKGSGTTTFAGAVGRTWTDSTAAKQDLGNVLVDGTTKTVTLASGVRATNVTIGSDDTLSAGGSNNFTVMGDWTNNGTFTAVSGTVTFATTTALATINQGNSSFYDLVFNGAGGSWRWQNTNATTSNNLTISAGTVTLPGGTLAVGGSFDNSGGTFLHNDGVLRLTATASGKNLRANGSKWRDLVFAGSGGGWTFLDANATTTGSLTILAGTPVFPIGTLEVGNNFDNQSGSFTANGGVLRMTSTSSARTIRLSNSSLAGLFIANAGGIFTMLDTNATTTGSMIIAGGEITFPSGIFTVGGSFLNDGIFNAGSGTLVMNAGSGSVSLDPWNSVFGNVMVKGNGNFTVSANATTTGTFILGPLNTFTQSSGTTFEVVGAFTNQAGGASTTWTGSTLYLNSGTNYSINAKTSGGDLYGTLKLGANTHIRSWNSSASTHDIHSTASLYAQDHAAVDGDLAMFGNYTLSSGTDYWSYAKDFDGTALGGSSRQVNVRFAAGATALYSDPGGLEMVGGPTASTTIDRQSTGNYGISFASSTLNATYYQFRNLDTNGLVLNGSTTVTSLSFGDFSVDVSGGSGITVSSTTIDRNPELQIFNVRFATSTGIALAYNVTETGTASSYWRFKQHYGDIAGEDHDNDPLGDPGAIRWDDSDFAISISGTVYADAGANPLLAPTCNDVTPVVRVKVDGLGNYAAPCSSLDGTFTVPGIIFSGDTVMTIYLDTTGGAQAVVVTRSAAGDLAGVKLYQHRVIVRHEDVTPLSIADMDAYDGGDDPDIPFIASTGGGDTLLVNPETEFWIWTGKTFTPGGDITLNSGGSGATYDGTFHIDNNATFTAVGAQTHSLGGRWVADSGATFTAASSTFIFTATTSGKSIVALVPITFWKMTFSGVGGNWSVGQSVTVGSDLTVTAGTISGGGSVTVHGASLSGGGAIAMTGGTFTFQNGGTFGGNTDWSFYNLTLGSGAVTTTTKTGSSTVTVSGALSVSAGHTLFAGSPSVWNIAGGGTPLVLSGTLSAQSSLFHFSSTTAVSVPPATYHRLLLAPSGAGSPTYTLQAGAFTVKNTLTVGDGTNPVSVNATANDPTIALEGNALIRAGATFIASDAVSLDVYRDLTNQGTFTHSGGTITFLATTTGRTITPGNSPFGSVLFNSSSGGWTIAGNATTTANFTLQAANDLTLSSGSTLEVDGTFTNLLGGGVTTWTGSTLYLNSGTNYSINAKTSGADIYGTLKVGANTHVRSWNSSAAIYDIASSGSLYSQDHASVDGSLYIFGNYARSSGSDYWSYAKDFDSTALGGSSRQVNVRFATSAAVTISGTGSLEVVGSATASSTLDTMSAGQNYALAISGGSTTMSYFSVRNMDANGMNFSGTPVVYDLSDGDLELALSGGAMITVAGATIDANPLKTFFRNRFATSTGVSSGFNVKVTGTSVSAWRFNLHYGNRAGEAYDSDPGGDPGYVIWDDSAAQLTISGNVYSDEGATPIGSPTCDGVSQNVRLKVQGLGSYASACNAGTGAYSISGVIFNPGDTITVYLDTGGGARAVNVAYDPATNINNMHLYQDRVIVRHEQSTAIDIDAMDQYDVDQDPDIPFKATSGSPDTLSVNAGTGFIVWANKTFAPGGNVTLHANASGASWDGQAHLLATSTWSAVGAETHTIGGQFWSENGASVSAGNSTFIFTATTSGKSIAATSSLSFYNVNFNGSSGSWNISGVGTTSNDLTITLGAVTLPSGTLAVGGSFDNSGGSFTHNGGTLKFTATASGKNIRANGYSFAELRFNGSGGGWTFLDTNATTSGSVVITAGTLVLPQGVFEVGSDFDNNGVFSANASSTLKMSSASLGRTIRLSGSSLGGLHVSGAGEFAFADQNATSTGDVLLSAGTTTLPSASLALYRSFTNTAVFDATTSTMYLVATSGARTISAGNSTFYNMVINGAGAFTMAGSATTTGNFRLQQAGAFTESPGTTLAVLGTFTNQVGGASTAWVGSTLKLSSGTSYAANTKTSGGDAYGTLELGSGTRIAMWNSTSTAYLLVPTASLYSQDHNAVDGSLYIYGAYQKTSGTDYWSYATDFDGTALGGSSRQVNVRFAGGASAYYAAGTTLAMSGTASFPTSVDQQSSGNYGIEIQGATWNAGYYSFRNMDQYGLKLMGTTTIAGMDNGDFELAVSGGTMITIASTTVDQNASTVYSNIRFATSTAISGVNVTRVGTTSNAITFTAEYGNMASEYKDQDGIDECGSIRFTDSACLFSDQKGYRWRNNDGGEGVPASEWYDQNWSKRKRVHVVNNSADAVSNAQVRLWVTYDSDMQSDFDDLRFTDSSGTTSIPHWIEALSASASSSVWVKVPTLPSGGATDVYMYYGNGAAGSAGSGTSTFIFFDDFEDASLSEYSGNTSLFEQSTSFNYERTRGIDASAGNESTGKTTDGIGVMSAGVGRNTTLRFHQYIDMSSGGSDEPCFLFAMQSPIGDHQNYGVCLSPYGADHLVIAKNVANNGRNDGSTQLVSKAVTYTTGWYEVSVDWLSSGNQLNVTVYDGAGAFFATTSATDASYTSGGVGFSYWSQHGGWDIPFARAYTSTSSPPAVSFAPEQVDSGASWKAAESTLLNDQTVDDIVRLRLTIRNTGTALPGEKYRLEVASKGAAPNCESVPSASYAIASTTSGAGCGSSPACMVTSAQFTNEALTTQLLSTPGTMTFTSGQIIEDPSNETGDIALGSGEFTETEYNFKMTPYATQNAYCFRATKAGTPLDNYTRVAELRVLQAPFITDMSFNSNRNIVLVEGTTTTIYATSTVTDFNGFADFTNATSTFFRSSVSGNSFCAADDNNCYQIGTSSCSFIDCSGNSCTLSCSAPLRFFADPTDIGSIFEDDNWQAKLDIWDTSGTHDSATSSQELYTLRALSIPATIDYGSVTVGQDTGGSNPATSVVNTGNSVLNLLLSGSDMTSGVSSIAVNKQKYATTTFIYSSCSLCNLLSTTTNPFGLNVQKPTTTTPFFGDIYWGLAVPVGTKAASHFGTTTFIAN